MMGEIWWKSRTQAWAIYTPPSTFFFYALHDESGRRGRRGAASLCVDGGRKEKGPATPGHATATAPARRRCPRPRDVQTAEKETLDFILYRVLVHLMRKKTDRTLREVSWIRHFHSTIRSILDGSWNKVIGDENNRVTIVTQSWHRKALRTFTTMWHTPGLDGWRGGEGKRKSLISNCGYFYFERNMCVL